MDEIKCDRKSETITIIFNKRGNTIKILSDDHVVLKYHDVSVEDISEFAKDIIYRLLNKVKKKYHGQYVDNYLKRADAQKFTDEMI